MIPHIKRVNKRLALGRTILSNPLQIVHAWVLGQPVTFCVNMKRDPIQRAHRNGRFYEMKELKALKRIFPEGGTFVDMGANVGNHSLFAAMFMGAKRVIPFEPNPVAFELLIHNVIVNNLQEIVDLSFVGVGLSDVQADGFAMEERDHNLGAARMEAGEGALSVHRADVLLDGVAADFIKIDVEGMELKVLAGLEGMLKTARPIIMAEVFNEADDAFFAWAEAQGYGHVASFARYEVNKNHLIADAAQVAALRETLQDTVFFAQQEAAE